METAPTPAGKQKKKNNTHFRPRNIMYNFFVIGPVWDVKQQPTPAPKGLHFMTQVANDLQLSSDSTTATTSAANQGKEEEKKKPVGKSKQDTGKNFLSHMRMHSQADTWFFFLLSLILENRKRKKTKRVSDLTPSVCSSATASSADEGEVSAKQQYGENKKNNSDLPQNTNNDCSSSSSSCSSNSSGSSCSNRSENSGSDSAESDDDGNNGGHADFTGEYLTDKGKEMIQAWIIQSEEYKKLRAIYEVCMDVRKAFALNFLVHSQKMQNFMSKTDELMHSESYEEIIKNPCTCKKICEIHCLGRGLKKLKKKLKKKNGGTLPSVFQPGRYATNSVMHSVKKKIKEIERTEEKKKKQNKKIEEDRDKLV